MIEVTPLKKSSLGGGGENWGDLAHFSLIILVKDTAWQHVSMNIAEKKEAVRRNISGSQDRRTVRAILVAGFGLLAPFRLADIRQGQGSAYCKTSMTRRCER